MALNRFSFSENFNDGILNGGDWSYSSTLGRDYLGSSVDEHDGFLDIQQAVTDNGGYALLTLDSPVTDARVEMTRLYHSAGNYYMGGTVFAFEQQDGSELLFNVGLVRSSYGDDYLNDPANYDHPRLNLGVSGDWLWDFALGVTTSDLLDVWNAEVVYFDNSLGRVDYDFNDDGIIDSTFKDDRLIGATLETIGFHSYGWWTGHYSQIDGLSISGLVANVNDDSYAHGVTGSAGSLFADGGKLLTMADLSLAAYHLADHEPRAARFNLQNPLADETYDALSSKLWFLGEADLPGLHLAKQKPWFQGISTFDGNRGIYTSENAAALVARSSDALFVSFRGTNDKIDSKFDQNDWRPEERENHVGQFLPLLKELRQYVRDSGETGDSITKIFLTGHSLGAGMVNPAYAWLSSRLPGIDIEGVTFANPGSIDTVGPANPKITNFVNFLDAIQAAGIVGDNWGETYKFNTLSLNYHDLFDLSGFAGLLDSHNMGAYREIARAFSKVGFDVGDIQAKFHEVPGWSKKWLDLEDRQLRLHVPLEVRKIDGKDAFYVGDGNDIVIAGAVEASIAAAKGLIGADGLGELPKLIKKTLALRDTQKFVYDPSVTSLAEMAFSIAETVADPNILGQALKKLSVLYTVGKTVLDTVDAWTRSDLIIGRDGNDFLNGLGGHDILFGGDGNDLLIGGSGVDELWGGDDNDTLDLQDHVRGNDNPDIANGGDGNDIYIVDTIFDRTIEFSGSGGIDTVISYVSWSLAPRLENLVLREDEHIFTSKGLSGTGNGLANTLHGGINRNALAGRGGDDFLFGFDAADTLDGGAGRDYLNGGAGADKLTGGAGADTFAFATSSEADGDYILDFEPGRDLIDISAIAAEVEDGKDFFIAKAKLSGLYAGAVKIIHKDRGDGLTVVKVNLDGGAADFSIKLAGIHDLTDFDFIF